MSFIISFEGIDGVGKSHQIQKLSEHLSLCQIDNIITRQPGGCEFGAMLREQILRNPDLEQSTRLFLFMADRAEHFAKVIKPALSEGKIVLCDRYIDSTLAYQGHGVGFDLVTIRLMHRLMEIHDANLVFLLDADVEAIAPRLGDDFFEKDLNFLKSVRKGYIFEHNITKSPSRWRYVDASSPIEEVEGDIRRLTKEFLISHGVDVKAYF